METARFAAGDLCADFRYCRRLTRDRIHKEPTPIADTDGAVADRNKIAFARWDKRIRESVRPLLTKKLIAEHKRDPMGLHSDALNRVLSYFRRPNRLERYVIICTRPFKQWRVARVSGMAGQGPMFADERSYNSEAKAAHAVFLMRVEQVMRD